MANITFGGRVPGLFVRLEPGVDNSFGINITSAVPADLVGVTAALELGAITYIATLVGTTYSWTLTSTNVAATVGGAVARLSLVTAAGARTVLGRGFAEVLL